MKKILALFLTAVMCLSLVACGRKTETIEITTDNWQEYFELQYTDTWNLNAFNEYDDVKRDVILVMKEEYISRLADNDENVLIIDFSCDTSIWPATVDFEAQTYTLADKMRKAESFREIQTISVNEVNEPHVLSNISLQPYTEDGVRYIMLCENECINRIEGTLILYVAEG